MKKILIAFLAFILGLGAYWARPLVSSVSLCEAKRNPLVLLGANVHIKGFLEVAGQDEYKTVSLVNLEDGCTTGVLINDELVHDDNARKLFEELAKLKSDDGAYLAEVEIVGNVKDLRTSGTTHCFGSPFESKIESIKQISPIRFYSNKETAKFRINFEE